MEYQEFRDYYKDMEGIVARLPIIGMLYSCGLHTYILIGCFAVLCHLKKRKGLVILFPSVVTVVMCLMSPVNAYERYMLPVMALLPVNIAWCYYMVRGGESVEGYENCTK